MSLFEASGMFGPVYGLCALGSMFLGTGCETAGALDDCVCKLDGTEIERCVSTELCSGNASSFESDAESCCGVSDLTFGSVSDGVDSDNVVTSCMTSFETSDGESLTITCSDEFSNY